MNTIQLQPISNQVRDGAKDAVQSAAAIAKEAADSTSSAARDIFQTAKAKAGDLYDVARGRAEETYQDVRTQADHTAQVTGQYVKANPVPALLGALAFGASLGCLLALALRRPQPSFRQQYMDEPMNAARDAIYDVLAPVVKRMRTSCEAAQDGTNKTLDGMHLKFW